MVGYSGFSESNNAVIAKSHGKYPLTIAAKELSKPTGYSKKVCRQILLKFGSCEYHHSSKFFNIVDFYDVKTAAETLTFSGDLGAEFQDELICDWFAWKNRRFYNRRYKLVYKIQRINEKSKKKLLDFFLSEVAKS